MKNVNIRIKLTAEQEDRKSKEEVSRLSSPLFWPLSFSVVMSLSSDLQYII